ncbi:hypothetical protein EV127DRAFT_471283 [Xylaria flabelliformis]|nr:hypothetical protein EV127DRAFT_471283 [Xylaria flabelliformis]
MARAKFRKTRRAPDQGEVDNVQFGRGSILVNGMIEPKPPNKTRLEKSNAVPNPSVAENDLYALNSLQLHRGRPLEQLTVQIPIDYLRDSLPPGAKNNIGIPFCATPYIFNCPDEDADRRIRKYYRKWKEFWDNFRTSEYVFWPIEAEDGYFVTAIFRMQKGQVDDPNFDPDADPNAEIPQVQSPLFNIVDGWSVVDAQRGDPARRRVDRVKDRIERIFAAEGITIDPLSYKDQQVGEDERRSLPWVPPPSDDDDWSSGIRSFALVRQLIQRVLDFYCSETGYQDSFFDAPTCGWLNVDQVRHEMMSICAVNALEDMDWNARLAVECIENIHVEGVIGPYRADVLEPDDTDKHAYVPASDVNNPLRRVP